MPSASIRLLLLLGSTWFLANKPCHGQMDVGDWGPKPSHTEVDKVFPRQLPHSRENRENLSQESPLHVRTHRYRNLIKRGGGRLRSGKRLTSKASKFKSRNNSRRSKVMDTAKSSKSYNPVMPKKDFKKFKDKNCQSSSGNGSKATGEFDLFMSISRRDSRRQCLLRPGCSGYQYSSHNRRCEVWKVKIKESKLKYARGIRCYIRIPVINPGCPPPKVCTLQTDKCGTARKTCCRFKCKGLPAKFTEMNAGIKNAKQYCKLHNCDIKACPKCKYHEHGSRYMYVWN
eukprot:472420_1